MQEKLVIKALEKAYLRRSPAPGLILHSDRGGRYVSERLRKLIKGHQSRQSMSRKSDSYDNAFAESLFSRFKAELLQGGTFLEAEDAQQRYSNTLKCTTTPFVVIRLWAIKVRYNLKKTFT